MILNNPLATTINNQQSEHTAIELKQEIMKKDNVKISQQVEDNLNTNVSIDKKKALGSTLQSEQPSFSTKELNKPDITTDSLNIVEVVEQIKKESISIDKIPTLATTINNHLILQDPPSLNNPLEFFNQLTVNLPKILIKNFFLIFFIFSGDII